MTLQPMYMQHTYAGLEPSQAFDVVYGGTFEHRLMSSKCATMEHQRLSLGDVRLETGRYNFPIIALGGMPKDAFSIGFMAEGADATRYNTTVIGRDEIQIYPPGVELLYHAAGPSRWVNFVVPEERLQEAAVEHGGRHLELSQLAPYSIRLRAGGRRYLTCLADDAMAVARRLQPIGGMTPDLAEAVFQSLLCNYVNALLDASSVRKPERLSTEQRHHYLIAACERLVLSGTEVHVGLTEIAKRSGYSLRSLELIFHHSVGMTPGRWFMTARLNGALRDLLASDQTATVSEIAMKWGFHHMSRFSQYYRQAFGESPRDTLLRSRMH